MNKKELVKITKYLNDKDINRGSSGNLSYRIKNGFPLPLDEFFNAPDFVTYMEEIILPGIEHRAILDIAVVRNWWSQIGQGHRGLPRKLWVAIAFEIWAQIFIDRSGAYPE